VGRLNGLERAELLFPALDFPVSLGCGLLDFVTIAFLACKIPEMNQI